MGEEEEGGRVGAVVCVRALAFLRRGEGERRVCNRVGGYVGESERDELDECGVGRW